jgi:hypothetical protein
MDKHIEYKNIEDMENQNMSVHDSVDLSDIAGLIEEMDI